MLAIHIDGDGHCRRSKPCLKDSVGVIVARLGKNSLYFGHDMTSSDKLQELKLVIRIALVTPAHIRVVVRLCTCVRVCGAVFRLMCVAVLKLCVWLC